MDMPEYTEPHQLLQDHPIFNGSQSVGMISGESPRWINKLPKEQQEIINSKGHELLSQDLTKLGLKHTPTEGRYGSPERSYIVYGPTQEQLVGLANKYGQDSVVHIPNGHKSAKIVYSDLAEDDKGQSLSGAHVPSTGNYNFHPTEKPEDYYTKLPGKGYVRLNFDFDNPPVREVKKSDLYLTDNNNLLNTRILQTMPIKQELKLKLAKAIKDGISRHQETIKKNADKENKGLAKLSKTIGAVDPAVTGAGTDVSSSGPMASTSTWKSELKKMGALPGVEGGGTFDGNSMSSPDNSDGLKASEMSPDGDDGGSDISQCGQCGGPNMLLGVLGKMQHFLCRNCGLPTHSPVEENTEAKDDAEPNVSKASMNPNEKSGYPESPLDAAVSAAVRHKGPDFLRASSRARKLIADRDKNAKAKYEAQKVEKGEANPYVKQAPMVGTVEAETVKGAKDGTEKIPAAIKTDGSGEVTKGKLAKESMNPNEKSGKPSDKHIKNSVGHPASSYGVKDISLGQLKHDYPIGYANKFKRQDIRTLTESKKFIANRDANAKAKYEAQKVEKGELGESVRLTDVPKLMNNKPVTKIPNTRVPSKEGIPLTNLPKFINQKEKEALVNQKGPIAKGESPAAKAIAKSPSSGPAATAAPKAPKAPITKVPSL